MGFLLQCPLHTQQTLPTKTPPFFLGLTNSLAFSWKQNQALKENHLSFSVFPQLLSILQKGHAWHPELMGVLHRFPDWNKHLFHQTYFRWCAYRYSIISYVALTLEPIAGVTNEFRCHDSSLEWVPSFIINI